LRKINSSEPKNQLFQTQPKKRIFGCFYAFLPFLGLKITVF